VSGRSALDVAPALNLVLAAGDAGNCFAVGDVLFNENAFGESVGVVGLENGDRSLKNDGSVIEMLVHKVDRAAGDLHAIVERLLLGIEAGEGGKQRGVDVENAVGECGDESGREQAHVAGEADEVDFVLVKAGDEICIVVGAGPPFGTVEDGGEAELSGRGKAGCVLNVGDNYGDFYVEQFARADVAGNGEEVGAAAGKEDAEAERRFSTFHCSLRS
jgi:hypothetical protein